MFATVVGARFAAFARLEPVMSTVDGFLIRASSFFSGRGVPVSSVCGGCSFEPMRLKSGI
jgi:hypothetical protein